MRFEKVAGPGEHACAVWRAPSNCCSEVSPGIRLVGGLADQQKDTPRAPAHRRCRMDWLVRKLGRAIAAGGSARHSRSARVRRQRERARRAFGDRAELARHQGRFDQGRSGGRGRPHDRLRFHRTAAPLVPATSRLPNPRAHFPSRCARRGGRAGLHRSLQLFVRERRDWRAISASIPSSICASPTRFRPSRA